MHAEYARDQQIRARFYSEAGTTSGLSHPHIARCFAYSEAEDGSPYIIMELLDGASLTSYMKPGLGYDAIHAVPIVRAILSGLGEAHRRGIIHRDIKPDNVFLVKNPAGPPVVKILDFGLAKVLELAGAQAKTRTGMMLGTPGYMSPEQIQSSKSVDARSDLWSVGVILYELLSGREAFSAPSEVAKLTLILTTDPVPVDHGKPHLAPWRGFFARAMARQIEHRFRLQKRWTWPWCKPPKRPVARMGRALRAHKPTCRPSFREAPRIAPRPHRFKWCLQAPASPARPPSDSTLKAGELPVLARRGSGAPVWVVFAFAVLGLVVGFVAGFFVGRSQRRERALPCVSAAHGNLADAGAQSLLFASLGAAFVDRDARARFDRRGDPAVAADHRPAADHRLAPQNGGVGIDDHVVFDGRVPLLRLGVARLSFGNRERAQGDALVRCAPGRR